jgi:foldase protein PrsA
VAEEVRATCISIKEDDELAQEMLDQITAGTDIIDIAKKLSEENKLEGPGSGQENPGDTGFFDKDVSESWRPFIDGVFELKVGEMTEELVEVEYGDEYYYMIFRKEEFHPERQETFEEVKDQIERTIEREKKRERILEWVEEVTGKGNLRKYPDRIPESTVKTSEENDEGESSDDNEETNEKTEKETDNE